MRVSAPLGAVSRGLIANLKHCPDKAGGARMSPNVARRLMDSRFRGNDGGGSGNEGAPHGLSQFFNVQKFPCKRAPRAITMIWINFAPPSSFANGGRRAPSL